MPRANTATADLFDLAEREPPRHDPGGKVATALPAGMSGQAEFYGDKEQYRLWLYRAWGKATDADPYILWGGMNPSMAGYDINDPTVDKEIKFSRAWGYKRYYKFNVMDYRATKPKVLREPGVIPRSDQNVRTVLRLAANADKIIVCYGVLPKQFQHYADETVEALRDAGHGSKLFAMGFTLLGHPRHPLYLPDDTKPIPYRRIISD